MLLSFCVFFFTDSEYSELYTLSLHDALPISDLCPLTLDRPDGRRILLRQPGEGRNLRMRHSVGHQDRFTLGVIGDRKSTRLNSSHANISYAVFCLKKKKNLEDSSFERHSFNI